MRCPTCNCEQFKRPLERSALEIYVCLNCGHEVAVHCNYPFPPSLQAKHDLFIGKHTVTDTGSATKNYLKLKNLLSGCERFQPEKLEKQFHERKLVWELGLFLDFEVELIKVECNRLAIAVDFSKVEESRHAP